MNILTTNKKINFIEKKLLGEELASGCRLLGSGGGGYLLFYVKSENRFNFIKTINILKIPYFNVRFDHQGLKVWEIER
jgi:galactokinase/mevalonate kinase-like predicted kinase